MSARKLEALRAEHDKKLAEATALAEAMADSADLSAEEQETQQADFNAAMKEVGAIKDKIANLNLIREAELNAPAVTSTAVPTVGATTATGVTATPGVERDPMRGFADAADFGRAVFNAFNPTNPQRDERLLHMENEFHRGIGAAAPSNAHITTGSANGDGYMVPPQMREELFEIAMSEDDILGQVDAEPTDSNSVEWSSDETTPWGSSGIQAYWTAEGAQYTSSRLSTTENRLPLHKLGVIVEATDELVADAPRLNRRLTTQSGRAISYVASEAIVRGTGAGQPLGWEASGALVTVAKESGQTADTIVAANVLKMDSRFYTGPGSRPRWYAHRSTIPQLATMTIGDQPAWTRQDGGLREAPNGLLLGKPIVFTEHAKTVGDAGDITLVDLAGYYAAIKRGGVQFASSIHLFFDYGSQAFRWTFRLGGQPFLSAPISPDNGSETRSHFVNLAARA